MAAQEVAFRRAKDRDITGEIRREVSGELMAALDREDIEDLSSALYKIPKAADKFGERLRGSPELVRGMDFSAAISFVDQASSVVVDLVRCCHGELNLERVKLLNELLESVEARVQGHMAARYQELYGGNYSAVQVLALKDLYELLEKLMERCREAGEIIARIALKHT